MLKTFKKTLDDGFFPFIILDTINEKVKHFEPFWSAAKTKGFEVSVELRQRDFFSPKWPLFTPGLMDLILFKVDLILSPFKVYVAEITADTQTCAKRNVHNRKLKDIMKVCKLLSLFFRSFS